MAQLRTAPEMLAMRVRDPKNEHGWEGKRDGPKNHVDRTIRAKDVSTPRELARLYLERARAAWIAMRAEPIRSAIGMRISKPVLRRASSTAC